MISLLKKKKKTKQEVEEKEKFGEERGFIFVWDEFRHLWDQHGGMCGTKLEMQAWESLMEAEAWVWMRTPRKWTEGEDSQGQRFEKVDGNQGTIKGDQ